MPLRGKALYVPGIGIDIEEIFALPREKDKYCAELDIPKNAHIYISVGELIHRKDHITAINAFTNARLDNAYYIICGIGELKETLQAHIEKLGMEEKIRLLGYRNDVKSLMKASDVFLFPSLQEGLPVALMEAMACGLPCIVSKIRGNVDLISDSVGGYLFDVHDEIKLCDLIKKMDRSFENCEMGETNMTVIKKYDIKCVRNIMRQEYKQLMEG